MPMFMGMTERACQEDMLLQKSPDFVGALQITVHLA